jgi:hypothetical protein
MLPKINIIGYIKKEHTPNWLLPRNRTFYNLIVNDKVCYLTWKNANECMLYVNGYKKPGLDVDNALYDNNECKEMFNVDINVLDKLLEKAVNNWESKQKYVKAGLSDEQAETALKI